MGHTIAFIRDILRGKFNGKTDIIKSLVYCLQIYKMHRVLSTKRFYWLSFVMSKFMFYKWKLFSIISGESAVISGHAVTQTGWSAISVWFWWSFKTNIFTVLVSWLLACSLITSQTGISIAVGSIAISILFITNLFQDLLDFFTGSYKKGEFWAGSMLRVYIVFRLKIIRWWSRWSVWKMVTYQFSSSQGSFAWFVDQPSRCKRPCRDFFPPKINIIASFTINYNPTTSDFRRNF